MYSPHFDTPPPQSQLRRPWSPDPNDPLPSSHFGRFNPARDTSRFNDDYDIPQSYRQQRREPSDVSVEALDLAEYAMTLRPHRNYQNDQYLRHDIYPPSSPPLRPQSRDSLVPPSLTSHGETLSSNSHSTRFGHRSRRPFSLPPQPTRSHRTSSPPSAIAHRYPAFGDARFSSPQVATTESEIDISQFPAWSRNWYNTPASPPDDIYTSLPKSQFDSKRSPFDPGNTYKYRSTDFDPYSSYGPTSVGHQSSRDILPWSNDPPEYGPSVDASLKEERMRMLEREFGPNASKSRLDKNDPLMDEDGKPLIGTVDPKGRIVTQGPRKRLAVRIFQIILAAAAGVPGIYAALVIKPKETPPPAGKPAVYALYVISMITLIGLLGLFVIRPCCCGRRSKDGGSSNPLASGMMVLPVQGLPGAKKAKKGKGGKKGKKGQPVAGDVQVNLIVDPHIFGGGQQDRDTDEEDEDGDWDGSMPGGFDSSRRRRRRNAPRRSVFAGFAMEEQWKRARAWMKKMTAVDVAGMVVWGAVFVFILLGPRCPIGGFEGWCNAYNTSSAAACLLCAAFAVNVFFDVKDLHSSKVSPRTRT